MDTRLEKALDISNYMVTLNNQKRLLKEKYKENLVHYYNGGQFTVKQELISFCQSLSALSQTETILIDDNDIPVEIENLTDFLTNIIDTYVQASNAFLVDYNKLKTNRSVESIMDI